MIDRRFYPTILIGQLYSCDLISVFLESERETHFAKCIDLFGTQIRYTKFGEFPLLIDVVEFFQSIFERSGPVRPVDIQDIDLKTSSNNVHVSSGMTHLGDT